MSQKIVCVAVCVVVLMHCEEARGGGKMVVWLWLGHQQRGWKVNGMVAPKIMKKKVSDQREFMVVVVVSDQK